MIWEDVLVERDVPDDALARAIADTFGIEPNGILVVDAVEDALARAEDGLSVLVERRRLAGAFRLHLGLFLRDAGLERSVASRRGSLAVLRRLADLLDCAILVGDESLDPSSFLLIRSAGTVEPVRLDIDRLDDDGFVSLLTTEEHREEAEIPA